MKFILNESIDADTFYYVSKQILVGNKPRNGIEGIHMSQDIETCKNLAKNKKYSNPQYYEFEVNQKINPYFVSYDLGLWRADDLCTIIYDDKEFYKTLTFDEKVLVNRYRYDDDDTKKIQTTQQDFDNVAKIFINHGYNCIQYNNEYELSSSNVPSTMFFDNSILSEGKNITEHIC